MAALLALAACAGDPSPAPSPEPSSALPPQTESTPSDQVSPQTAEPTVFSPFPTLDIPINPTLEDPGFPTPDPNAPPVPTEEVQPPPSGFDQLVLIRTGGPTLDDGSTPTLSITIRRDGSIEASGARGIARGALSQPAITQLAEMVTRANIFTLNATFLGPVPAEPPLPFIYNLTVTSGSYERSISAQEGYMPTPIQTLIGTILSEGLRLQ